MSSLQVSPYLQKNVKAAQSPWVYEETLNKRRLKLLEKFMQAIIDMHLPWTWTSKTKKVKMQGSCTIIAQKYWGITLLIQSFTGLSFKVCPFGLLPDLFIIFNFWFYLGLWPCVFAMFCYSCIEQLTKHLSEDNTFPCCGRESCPVLLPHPTCTKQERAT